MNKIVKKEWPTKREIDEVLSGKSNIFTSEQVAEWFSTKEGNSFLSDEMDRSYQEDNDTIDHIVPSDMMWDSIVKRKKQRRLIRYISAAAAVAVIFLGGFFAIHEYNGYFEIEQREIYVQNGEHLQVLFQDGSKVILNADSRLKYPAKFGRGDRVVGLEGEALFEIEHVGGKDFFVEMPNGRIRVTGTVFNVNAYPDSKDIKIYLKEGSIDYIVDNQIIAMQPGELLTYDKATNKASITCSTHSELEAKWIDNVFYFQDTPLQEVIDELERSFDIKFTVTDPDVYDNVFTIVFNNKSYKDILSDLTKISPLEFEVDGANVIVGKK